MLESDEIKALPKKFDELQKFVTGLTADFNKSMTKAEERLDKIEAKTKDFFGDYNKSLDKLDASDRDATKIIDKLLERVKALEQQVAKLSKK